MRSKNGMQNYAVAGVIEALLLVALVAIIISMIQLVYVPQIMEQKEADHMDQAFNQFSTLKSMVDMQTMTQSTSPISSVLTLGSARLPYFLTVQAWGGLTYINDTTTRITINNASTTWGILSSLHYDAQNSYFVSQNYVLEGGGIIVQQETGNPVMRAAPSISYDSTNPIMVHFDLPTFVETAGKVSTQGEGKCFVRTVYLSTDTPPHQINGFGLNEKIQIHSKYAAAWNQSLHDALGALEVNGYLKIQLSSGANPFVEITRIGGMNQVNVEINIFRIQVQIGPGWVE